MDMLGNTASVNSVADMARAAASAPSRTVYLYDVPSSTHEGAGVRSLGLVALTASEEVMAHRRAGTEDPFRLATELIKQALWEVDGRRVSVADGSADAAWNALPAPVRQLVATAYGELNNPPQEVVQSFLASRTVRVG